MAARSSATSIEAEMVDLFQTVRRAVRLCGALDDGVQLHVARNAGSLRDLPSKAAWFQFRPNVSDRNHLRVWNDLRRKRDWLFVAELGKAARHHSGRGMWNVADPSLDFCAEHWAADCRRISDSVHGPGRVGSCSYPFE